VFIKGIEIDIQQKKNLCEGEISVRVRENCQGKNWGVGEKETLCATGISKKKKKNSREKKRKKAFGHNKKSSVRSFISFATGALIPAAP